MPSLDTNVLVRYLVADDREQFTKAKLLIESCTEDTSLYIPVSVIIELEWVLRSRYELDKDTLLSVFAGLLETRELNLQDESALEVALSLYSDHNADFVDCYHLASAYIADESPMVTFDRKAARIPGAELLD